MNTLIKLKNIYLKEGIINFIKRKFNIPITKFTINYRGEKTKIILNREFGYVDMVILKDGIYEKEIVDDIYGALSKEKTLVDIGSNIGQHSLLLAPYCKQIYAFEPIIAVYNQFNSSIKLNNYSNIQTFNLAISNKKDSKNFNFVKNHAGTSSFVERESKDETETITVHTDTLNNVLGDKKVDVMKIDVEGFEAVVVLGNKDFILKNRPTLFLEFSPEWIHREGNHSPKELFSFFDENNFSIFSRNTNSVITKDTLNINKQDNWIIKAI